MNLIEPILAEFAHEGATTRRVLERVAQQHFDWRPHAKSMTMGRLATHLAEIPGYAPMLIGKDSLDLNPDDFKPTQVTTNADLLRLYDKNVSTAMDALKGLSNERLLQTWRFLIAGVQKFELPRLAAMQGWIFHHSIHHRGQLTVYLRLKDVPVPAIYGPSADEEAYGPDRT